MTAGSENCEQWQNSLYGKRQLRKVSFSFSFFFFTLFSPSPFPNVNVTDPQWARLCAPTSDSQNPNFNSSPPPPPFFFSVSKFGQKSFLCEVVLSRMANKQSHLRTGYSTLQHFRHLFQLTACLTSAGWILLTQDCVSWTGIGALQRHNGTFPLPPTAISLLRR